MLSQNIEPAAYSVRTVKFAGIDGFLGGAAFQDFEPVGGHEKRAGGFVQPVIGPANPLNEAGGAFRCAKLDDEVDITPVNAEIERGGADHGFEASGSHGGLDLAALFDIERAMVEGDGKRVFIGAP